MTINIVTLGCSKNIVDSEKLLKQLELNGYEIFHNADHYTDLVIINTCGFILDAKTESIETILSYARAKEIGYIKKIYVIGCLSERYMTSLKQEIPIVDEFFGVNDFPEIISSLGGKYHSGFINSRILTTPSHYAYLKISEGCNRGCSFCAIPEIRGKQVSVPEEQVLKETYELTNKGVKEIILIAQDLTSYGTDLYGKKLLIPLLKTLSEVKDIQWLRLHYLYPESFLIKEICKMMNSSEALCRYIDIPFQHINDRILQKMRRGHGKKEIMEIISFLRRNVTDISLRTTLITGFPGETEQEFIEMCDFVKDVRFERLGVFTYSHEDNILSESESGNVVPENEKISRMEEILKLQENISSENNAGKIGKVFKTIIDREEGEFFAGRTEHDSPEIDNEVLIPKSLGKLETGRFYKVKITDAMEFDLFGEVVAEEQDYLE